jgi:hypothetical protein
MPCPLAVFFVRILRDKGHLGVLIAEEGPQTHEIQIGRHEQDCVPRVVFVELVPDLLGEEREASVVGMLKGLHVGEPS